MGGFTHATCAVFAVPRSRARRDHLRVAESAAGDLRLSSAIVAAIDDMCQDLERYEVRQQQRLRLTRCIAAAAELIEELEGLCLAGRSAVPRGWQSRLDRFMDTLPPGVAGELRSGTLPTRLLDQVFEIEERLFRLKLGDWARAFEALER
jgi:hypothetical protein